MTENRRRPIVQREQLDAAIEELLAFADERATVIRRQNQQAVYATRGKMPNIDHLVRASLREALEDEVLPAVSTDPKKTIHEIDVDREVIKKALVGLKLEGLRRIARQRSLPLGGSIEEVATRVAAAYRWSEEEIARLVLENDPDEIARHRGHRTRLFALEETPDLEYVRDRLGVVVGRYVRIGIARWFVFREILSGDESVTVKGEVEAYQAFVAENVERPTLTSVANQQSADVTVTALSSLAEVRGTSAPTARAAIDALATAAQLAPLGYVPLKSEVQGLALQFSPYSVFLLDLLYTRFRQAGLRNLNLTVAKFRVADVEDDEDSDDRPGLTSVKFEGAHLLDSPEACRLLAEEGRPLVDVAAQVDFSFGGSGGRYPVRVSIDRDHSFVFTGYGKANPELSAVLHRLVVEAVREQMQNGLADLVGLNKLLDKVNEQSRSAASDTPKMFDDGDASAGQSP